MSHRCSCGQAIAAPPSMLSSSSPFEGTIARPPPGTGQVNWPGTGRTGRPGTGRVKWPQVGLVVSSGHRHRCSGCQWRNPPHRWPCQVATAASVAVQVAVERAPLCRLQRCDPQSPYALCSPLTPCGPLTPCAVPSAFPLPLAQPPRLLSEWPCVGRSGMIRHWASTRQKWTASFGGSDPIRPSKDPARYVTVSLTPSLARSLALSHALSLTPSLPPLGLALSDNAALERLSLHSLTCCPR